MTREFKLLEKKWYDKLKESGFEDIEEEDHEHLKKWHSSYFQCRYTKVTFLRKRKYYEQAADFLHSHPFEKEIEQMIWRFHSEGIPIRVIAKEIQMKNYQVFTILAELKKKMLGSE